MNLTPTGFGIIVAILLVVAVIVVIAENLRVRRENEAPAIYAPDDDRLAEQVARYHCAGHGCYLVVVSSDSRGTRWECAVCKTQSWVPCADVYDQQSDVSEWEGEVGA